ncbi:MAG: hypothetical protein CVU56_18390 [Deltaproteobacteria bacterium HGW-Deltaproteobacteria-14]|jgi:hypothetical protein|nr:MAG: hypothetical protein CVU56_18390 [Deltaproteobacteria bacterium HGW-Deltaproteobacteria-14]
MIRFARLPASFAVLTLLAACGTPAPVTDGAAPPAPKVGDPLAVRVPPSLMTAGATALLMRGDGALRPQGWVQDGQDGDRYYQTWTRLAYDKDHTDACFQKSHFGRATSKLGPNDPDGYQTAKNRCAERLPAGKEVEVRFAAERQGFTWTDEKDVAAALLRETCSVASKVRDVPLTEPFRAPQFDPGSYRLIQAQVQVGLLRSCIVARGSRGTVMVELWHVWDNFAPIDKTPLTVERTEGDGTHAPACDATDMRVLDGKSNGRTILLGFPRHEETCTDSADPTLCKTKSTYTCK